MNPGQNTPTFILVTPMACTTKCKFDAISFEKTLDNCGTEYFKTLLVAMGNAPAAAARFVSKKILKK